MLSKIKQQKKILIPISIVIMGILVFYILIKTRPTASKLPKKNEALLVEVTPVAKVSKATLVEATGTIVPAVQIPLQTQVSGRIIEVSDNFIPGGIIKKGDVILKVDPTDFRLELKQRQSELATAQANLKLEQGNQSIAKAEYDLLSETLNQEDLTLVLRKPHIEIVESKVDAAKAAVERAEVDLARTTITAPFNGAILERSVEIGAQISQGSAFGSFVGTDKYWLEAKIPVDHLKWLEFPTESQEGSTVEITNSNAWGEKNIKGKISHVSKNLEQNGRLLTVYVSIDSPLKIAKEKGIQIFLNSYVNLKILGKELENVISISRDYLRNGDIVWVMNEKNEMEIRKIKIEFKGVNEVFISDGLKEGEFLIKSNVNTPVAGMKLRTSQTPTN